MKNKSITAVIYILIVIVGLLLSFFVIFNFMLSDTASVVERALSFGITAVAYGVVGVAAAFIRPGAWKTMGLLLSLPALAVTFLYSLRERNYVWLYLIYFTVAAAFAFLGAYLSHRIRTGRE